MNICSTTKSSTKGGTKRPWFSHKISWTLGSTSFDVLGGFKPWSMNYKVEK
jgi:hypothetical protein